MVDTYEIMALMATRNSPPPILFDSGKELPNRLCVIFSEIVRWPVHILDLEVEKPPRFDPYADELVNLDHPCGHGFVDRVPNIVLRGFECPCFCGIGDEVFIFEGLSEANFKLDDEMISLLRVDSMMSIYRFGVSSFSEEWDCRIDKTMLEQIGYMHGPKLEPEAIRYGSSVLVFSKCIAYISGDDATPDAVDFELYTPGRQSMRLPSLRVSRRRGPLGAGCSFYLLHMTSKRERLSPIWLNGWGVPKCPCVSNGEVGLSCCGSSFMIQSFSLVDEHLFVVTTSVSGVTLCLNLESPEEWKIFRCATLPHPDRNFVTTNGLVLYPSGASVFSDDTIRYRVEFPLSSYVSSSHERNCLMEFIEDTKFAFVVQVGFDYALRPHWTLDLLKLDVSKFSSCLEKEKEKEREKLKLKEEKGIFFTRKEDDEFAKRIKTYKFFCRGSDSDYAPVCMFPF